MRIVRILALVSTAAMAGCVSPSNESVPGPNGLAFNETKCSGSPNGCFKKAAETCRGPYQVVDSSSNAGGALADMIPGPVTWYRMSYQCGRSDGRLPQFPFRGREYRPTPVVITQPARPTTTNCSAMGSSVTCTSY